MEGDSDWLKGRPRLRGGPNSCWPIGRGSGVDEGGIMSPGMKGPSGPIPVGR